MLAKMNIPVSPEVGLVAVTIGAAHGYGKEEEDSDSGAFSSICPIHKSE